MNESRWRPFPDSQAISGAPTSDVWAPSACSSKLAPPKKGRLSKATKPERESSGAPAAPGVYFASIGV